MSLDYYLGGISLIPIARGRMVRGRAMSGSTEKAEDLKREAQSSEMLIKRRERKKIHELRSRVKKQGYTDAQVKAMSVEHMRGIMAKVKQERFTAMREHFNRLRQLKAEKKKKVRHA